MRSDFSLNHSIEKLSLVCVRRAKMRRIFSPISARDMATSCLVMSDPPPKTSEVLTGSSMQKKIPNVKVQLWNLGFVDAYQNSILRGQGLST